MTKVKYLVSSQSTVRQSTVWSGAKIPNSCLAGRQALRDHSSRWTLGLLFVLCFSGVFCQNIDSAKIENQYQLLYQLDIEALDFTTDKLQNIYYISPENEVVKLRPDGTEQFRYLNKTYGLPTYLDATNPFNLLLFYPDYQNVIVLDRTMNLAAQFNLFQLGLFGLEAVGMAGDGNLWAYDPVNFRLKKIGRTGSVILQSNDLSLELNRSFQPVFLTERDQQVFLNDPEQGILVFDVFGKYLKTLPILHTDHFQIVGGQLLFVADGQMQSFHLQSLLQSPIKLPAGISENSKLRVEKERLYVLDKEGLKVFRF